MKVSTCYSNTLNFECYGLQFIHVIWIDNEAQPYLWFYSSDKQTLSIIHFWCLIINKHTLC